MQYAMLADRWLLAVILLVTGISKMKSAEAFSEAIGRYGIVPRPLVPPLAAVLPFTEIVLGLALAVGAMPVAAGPAAAALFVAFGGAISWNLAHGRRFDCGCGLGGEAQLSWGLVLRNLALTVLAAAISVGPSAALAVSPGVPIPAHSPGGTAFLPIPLIAILGCLLGRLVMDAEFAKSFPRQAAGQGNRAGRTVR